MSKVGRLLEVYSRHIGAPWQPNLAGPQRVIFAVYDKHDELRLRAQVGGFDLATRQAGHDWRLIDLTDAFPRWLSAHRDREAYFEHPEDLDGYEASQISGFKRHLIDTIQAELAAAGAGSVVAVLGVGTLFGLARVSAIVEAIAPQVPGRLLVFFPGEYADNNYRLLDARDGWNYLAVPLLAIE